MVNYSMLTQPTGIIGPGLLVSSGNALAEGGPAGALISFSLVGIIVFFVMYKIRILGMKTTLTGLGNPWARWPL